MGTKFNVDVASKDVENQTLIMIRKDDSRLQNPDERR